jgi:Tol biopolymer transport system component
MERLKKFLTLTVEICALIALMVGLSFILRNRPETEESLTAASQPYPTPGIRESEMPTPTVDQPVVSQTYPAPNEEIATQVSVTRPPACQLDFFTSKDGEITKADLEFSEPKVILSNQGAIGIVRWLPDNNRLLLASDTPSGGQRIETLDTQTLETQLLSERNGAGGKPVWLNSVGAVAFSTFIDGHEEIWLSEGNPEKSRPINLDAIGSSLSSDGERLLFLSPNTSGTPQFWDPKSGLTQQLSLNLMELEYPKANLSASSANSTLKFQSTWSPDGSKVVFYTNPWIYLFDIYTGQICEIELGGAEYPRWAYTVQWSPDGRYLSLLTTTDLPGMPYTASDMILVDLSTGKQQIIPFAPELSPGQHYVTDLTWKNDGTYLIALAVLRLPDGGGSEEGLFLIDPSTGIVQQVNSSMSLGGGTSGWQLAWSNDSANIAVNCPTPEQGRLCIIPVKTKGGQP